MAYASPADVEIYTGKTVTSDQIEAAQAIVEIYSRRSENASEFFSEKDERILKQATSYQAAFMLTNNVFDIGDIYALSQGDLTVTYKNLETSSADSKVLSPLARKAIKSLSWMKSRSVRVESDFTSRIDDEDEYLDWETY